MSTQNHENSNLTEKTKSLNQSGAFLQIYILDELRKKGWATLSEYPIRSSPFIEEPRNHHLIQSRLLAGSRSIDSSTFVKATIDSMSKSNREETSIDIVATKTIARRNVLNFCIESKKLDPRFMDWIFFQLEEKKENFMRMPIRDKASTEPSLFTVPIITGVGLETRLRILNEDMEQFRHTVTDFAISLKDKQVENEYYKSDKTKIDESVRQIITGTYGYIMERILDQISKLEPVIYNGKSDYFVPIVVTNANLYLCKIDVEKINPETGHLKSEPVYQQVDSVIYECPPPKIVQFPDLLSANLTAENARLVSKWHVLILSPKGFVNFLDSF